MRTSTGSRVRVVFAMLAAATLVIGTTSVAAGVAQGPRGDSTSPDSGVPDHLVISEVMTGGQGASDEFIEIYNPTAEPLPLADIELVYVSASGATIAKRAGWGTGSVPPYEHLLAANEAGIFATIADVRYSGGLSATGGSAALRWVGEDAPIDAVGWGSASSDWMEGRAVAAPPAGVSVERLPGGDAGSGFDTDDNATDFVERADPEPQNSESPPAVPGEPPSPGPTPSVSPPATGVGSPSPLPGRSPSPSPTSSTSTPSESASATPAPAAVPISAARTAPSGTRITVRGVALTSSSFNDGGGYIGDDTGGIAVLVSAASFERGERIQVTGEVSQRYHQTTMRVDASDLSRLGVGSDPASRAVATGEVDEDDEAELVEVTGRIMGAPVELSAGLAYQVDDGTGAVRVLVLDATGIDTAQWQRDAEVHVRGVVGQRDASGTGTAGYRVQPRDRSDVLGVEPPGEATPSPPPRSEGPGASASAAPSGLLVTIAAARAAEPGAAVRVRGVVTAASGGIVDERSAVIQDASGAILLRLAEDAGTLARGTLVEVSGERATKAGMATLRAETISHLGQQAEPQPLRIASGALDDAHEAQLVVVRGVVASSVRDSSTGSVSFDLDDGSGPGRVFAFASTGIAAATVERGSWVEVTGVLGQETSGDRQSEGYRIWPRDTDDIRVVAPAIASDEGQGSEQDASRAAEAEARSGSADSGTIDGEQDLAAVLEAGGSPRPARATLVVGAWPELGLAGILWDGTLVFGVADTADATQRIAEAVPVPPAVVEIEGVARPGEIGPLSGTVLEVDTEAPIRAVDVSPIPPATDLPPGTGAVWGRVAGTVTLAGPEFSVVTPDSTVRLEYACDGAAVPVTPGSAVIADGLLAALDDGGHIILVPCDGLRLAPTLAWAGVGPQHGSPDPATPTMADPRAPTLRTPPILPVAGLGIPLLGVLGTIGWRIGTFQRLRHAYRALTEPTDDDTAPRAGVLSDTG